MTWSLGRNFHSYFGAQGCDSLGETDANSKCLSCLSPGSGGNLSHLKLCGGHLNAQQASPMGEWTPRPWCHCRLMSQPSAPVESGSGAFGPLGAALSLSCIPFSSSYSCLPHRKTEQNMKYLSQMKGLCLGREQSPLRQHP